MTTTVVHVDQSPANTSALSSWMVHEQWKIGERCPDSAWCVASRRQCSRVAVGTGWLHRLPWRRVVWPARRRPVVFCPQQPFSCSSTPARPSELQRLKRSMLTPPAVGEFGHASKWTIACFPAPTQRTPRQDTSGRHGSSGSYRMGTLMSDPRPPHVVSGEAVLKTCCFLSLFHTTKGPCTKLRGSSNSFIV